MPDRMIVAPKATESRGPGPKRKTKKAIPTLIAFVFAIPYWNFSTVVTSPTYWPVNSYRI